MAVGPALASFHLWFPLLQQARFHFFPDNPPEFLVQH